MHYDPQHRNNFDIMTKVEFFKFKNLPTDRQRNVITLSHMWKILL